VRRHSQEHHGMNERNQSAFSIRQDSELVHMQMTQCP
jgi:hypothetical protein